MTNKTETIEGAVAEYVTALIGGQLVALLVLVLLQQLLSEDAIRARGLAPRMNLSVFSSFNAERTPHLAP